MGTKLKAAIIKPKNPFSDWSSSNMWSGLTKMTPKKSKPIKSFTKKTEADVDRTLKSHPAVASS